MSGDECGRTGLAVGDPPPSDLLAREADLEAVRFSVEPDDPFVAELIVLDPPSPAIVRAAEIGAEGQARFPGHAPVGRIGDRKCDLKRRIELYRRAGDQRPDLLARKPPRILAERLPGDNKSGRGGHCRPAPLQD